MDIWRDGGHHPGLITQLDEHSLSRVGYCWMRGRLLVGDLVMAISQAGDCFWQYQLVDNHAYLGSTNKLGYKLIPESAFGAYVLGVPYMYQPTPREMHLLMAGEMVSLEADPRHLSTLTVRLKEEK